MEQKGGAHMGATRVPLLLAYLCLDDDEVVPLVPLVPVSEPELEPELPAPEEPAPWPAAALPVRLERQVLNSSENFL